MMKKQEKTIYTVIGIVAVILILNSLGVFDRLNPFAIVNEEIDSNVISVPKYKCDADADFCLVTGKMICDTERSVESEVIFRTNALNAEDYFDKGTWIAINGVTSGQNFILTDGLNGYCRETSISSTALFQDRFTPTNNRIGVWNSALYVEVDDRWIKYVACSLSEEQLSVTPVEPYASNNQEEDSGDDVSRYNCESEVRVDGNLRESLSYSNQFPGNRSSSQFTLDPTQEFEIIGIHPVEISWASYREIETCPEGNLICSPEAHVLVCRDNTYITQETCSYGCLNGKCLPPYSIDKVELVDSDGDIITLPGEKVFRKDEKIVMFLTLSSQVDDSIGVTAKIKKGNPVDGTTEQTLDKVQHTSGRRVQYTFEGIEFTGSYFITLELDINGQILSYGTEALNTIPFDVSSEYDAIFRRPYQTLAGQTNREDLYQNYPITIELVTRSGDDDVFLDGLPTITKLFIGGTSADVPVDIVETKGLYTFTLTPLTSGNLDIDVVTQYGGLQKTVSTETKIIPEDVNIIWKTLSGEAYNPNDIGGYTMKVGTSYLFEFETRNRIGELIDTTNTLRIFEVTKDVWSTDLLDCEGGRCSFTYAPASQGGHEFNVKSSFLGLKDGEASTGQIEANFEDVKKCASDSDCGFLSRCGESDRCELKVTTIAILMGAIAVGIILVVILINLVKKKKKPNFGRL